MWSRSLICIFITALFIGGCSSKKLGREEAITGGALSKAEARAVLAGLEENQSQFQTFSGKAKTKLSVQGKSFSATSNLRIQKQEAIWISITAILGIEVARVLITPERIQIINRIQNQYTDKPFQEVYKYTGRELSFDDLSELLIGNLPEFTLSSASTLKNSSLGYELSGSRGELEYSAQVGRDLKTEQIQLEQIAHKQSFFSQYDRYTTIGEQQIPQRVGIQVNSPSLELELELDYSSTRLNEPVALPFNVPEGFKQK